MELKEIKIEGYKSIRSIESLKLNKLNVLIGANGAGKSNLISFFKLIASLARNDLQSFIQDQGGPDSILYRGRKQTPQLSAELNFGPNAYKFGLKATADNRLIFSREQVSFRGDFKPEHAENLGTNHEESNLSKKTTPVRQHVLAATNKWRLYHFHDTSSTAKVKQFHASNDNIILKEDASNLAAYIARLKSQDSSSYKRIVDTIRLAAPFFDDFLVRDPLPDSIQLEWKEKGNPDTPYKAHFLSDGTLRFICLTTLLLQPTRLLPSTILIDEPELGLHPYAINLLASILKEVSREKQIIVSTQSVELINNLEPEDIVVVNREDDRGSIFQRLDIGELKNWLDDYTLGELWKKNILGGRPS